MGGAGFPGIPSDVTCRRNIAHRKLEVKIGRIHLEFSHRTNSTYILWFINYLETIFFSIDSRIRDLAPTRTLLMVDHESFMN